MLVFLGEHEAVFPPCSNPPHHRFRPGALSDDGGWARAYICRSTGLRGWTCLPSVEKAQPCRTEVQGPVAAPDQ